MRVRILKAIISSIGGYSPGMVANLPKKVAESWIKAGIAMEEKSRDGAKETK